MGRPNTLTRESLEDLYNRQKGICKVEEGEALRIVAEHSKDEGSAYAIFTFETFPNDLDTVELKKISKIEDHNVKNDLIGLTLDKEELFDFCEDAKIVIIGIIDAKSNATTNVEYLAKERM